MALLTWPLRKSWGIKYDDLGGHVIDLHCFVHIQRILSLSAVRRVFTMKGGHAEVYLLTYDLASTGLFIICLENLASSNPRVSFWSAVYNIFVSGSFCQE